MTFTSLASYTLVSEQDERRGHMASQNSGLRNVRPSEKSKPKGRRTFVFDIEGTQSSPGGHGFFSICNAWGTQGGASQELLSRKSEGRFGEQRKRGFLWGPVGKSTHDSGGAI